MKSLFSLLFLLTIGLSFTSCSSSRPIVDDNVYMLKTAAIPIGENLLDETSYATFKYREQQNNPTNGYYDPNTQTNARREPDHLFGRNRFFYGMYGMNGIYGMNQSNYFGYNSYMHFGPNGYYSPYYSPYDYYNPYGYYNPNSFYGSYGGFGGYGNYNGFYGNNNFGNNYYYVGNQVQTTTNPGLGLGHHVSGPRSTNSGYYTGLGRGGAQQLKSQTFISNSPSVVTYHSNASTISRNSNSAVYDRNAGAADRQVQNSTARPTMYSRGNTGNNSGSAAGSRPVPYRQTVNSGSSVRPSSGSGTVHTTTRTNSEESSPSSSPRSSGGGHVNTPSHSPSSSPSSRPSTPTTGGGRRN